MKTSWWATFIAASLLACSARDGGPRVSNVALADGVVAKVDDVTIPISFVQSVAATNDITPREAALRLIDDAVAARGARASRLHENKVVARDLTAARARLLVLRFRAEAHAAGPPTPLEVTELSERRWREVAVPEQVKVIHAVVRRIAGKPETDADGAALARDFAKAAATAHSSAEFETNVRAVPPRGRDIVVQELPPFGADGRLSEGPESSVEGPFTAAATRLPSPGATSDVVETNFGWHVIRLLERIPARGIPPAERARYFEEDIYRLRAQRKLEDTLDATRAQFRVELSGAADALMAEVTARTL